MSKTKRFEIYTDEPHGPTFDEMEKLKFAGEKNKKKSARFGIIADEPTGDTFVDGLRSHIDFPKADSATLLGNKVIADSSGQGEYEPPKSTLPDATAAGSGGGSISIGKSSPKHGKGMKPMTRFKP